MIAVEPEQIMLPEIRPTMRRRTAPLHEQLEQPQSYLPAESRPPKRAFTLPRRIIPILLTISCLFFLLASGILVFIVLKRQPSVAPVTLKASPATLRVDDSFSLAGSGFGADTLVHFTYDNGKTLLDSSGQHALLAHSDAQGAFTVYIKVSQDWAVGDHAIHAITKDMSANTHIMVQQAPPVPPHLQLSLPQINLGAEQYQSTVTLKNSGGGQILWQAQSDSPWLTATPLKGTFNGQQLVMISVNHSGLQPQQPQSYTGHLTFTAQNNAGSATLSVKMQVNPSPAALNISTSALTFSTVQGQSPAAQSISLQNSGGTALNWSSVVVTGDGTPWLVFAPVSGQISAGASAVALVSIQAQQLAAGQYSGTITINGGGASAPVTVSLTVWTPANLVIAPVTLTPSVVASQNAPGSTLTLQNSGELPLTWTASSNQPWLSVTPTSGTLAAQTQATIAIAFTTVTLKAGNYHALLTISDGSQSEQLAVMLTVTSPPAAIITLPTTPLTFSTYLGSNPPAQSFTLTNTGNAPLHWAATESGSGSSVAPVTPTSGTLAPSASTTLTVTPNVVNSAAGTLSSTITLADSDTGTTVASQKIAVTITILDQANISVSTNQITLSNSANTPDSSTILQITNNGTQALNWVATPQASATWLSVDVGSGTLSPGASTIINVHANSSQLAAGTYTATLTISDSDANTPVAPQTIQVTLTVQ